MSPLEDLIDRTARSPFFEGLLSLIRLHIVLVLLEDPLILLRACDDFAFLINFLYSLFNDLYLNLRGWLESRSFVM